ncbi:E3 ubiquitin-protein ligase TRIM33-like [Amphiura filiformis]|uniref:E3 ubiquitin-protein ligase TRIM33-like n=1 Tax=Amphiura filiformis TaxID=82378 RepID=UPI003B212471
MAASTSSQSCDLTKCSKCHQLLKSPRSLPCLHSYCATCLDDQAKDSPISKVKCVECGEEFDIPPGGLKEWQPLAIVHRLTEQKAMQMELMSKETIHCTSCTWFGGEGERDKPVPPTAVARCTECDDYLCKQCFAIHKSQRHSKDHPVITLQELREGKVPDASAAEQKMCVKHKGESLFFYCETCDVPICRQCVVITHSHPEHKYSEIEQATKERNQKLQQLHESSGKNEEEVNKALQEIRRTRRDFDLAISEAKIQIKDTVQKLKFSYLKRLDEARKIVEDELNIIEKEGLETIKTADNQLLSIISRISTAKAITKILKESGSEFELASDYGSLKAVLQEVTAAEPATIINAGQSLTEVKFEENTVPNSDKIVIGRVWSRGIRRNRELKKTPVLKMEFGNTGNEKLSRAIDVAVTATRDIAVTDHTVSKVKIFHANGAFKSAFKVNEGIDAGQTTFPWCIQAGPDNLFYVTDWGSPYVKIFDLQGTYKRYFHTVSPDKVDYSTRGSSKVCGLAFNLKDEILAGNTTHNFISCHSLDGKHLMSIKLTIPPWFLGVTSNGSIIVSPYSNDSGSSEVQIIDSTGKILSKLQTPIGVSSWSPAGLVISTHFKVDDDEDEVFVADRANGHAVYRYSASGKYIGCVTKDVSNIEGLSLSGNDNLLFVGDSSSVKCFEI